MTGTDLVNGVWSAGLDPADRGLAYGDGLFETLLITANGVALWPRHRARLQAGCARLAITVDWPAVEREMTMVCEQGLARLGEASGVVKLVITRAPGGRGYSPHRSEGSYRYWSLNPLPESLAEPVNLPLCQTALARQPALAGLKHLCRLEQVLARAEWTDPTIAEGLMLDTEGYLREGTMSNLFFFSHDRLLTPALDHCGVKGVMRELVLEELAPQQRLSVEQGDFPLALLMSSTGAFICNSVIGIKPVASIDGKPLPGNQHTTALQAQLRAYMAG